MNSSTQPQLRQEREEQQPARQVVAQEQFGKITQAQVNRTRTLAELKVLCTIAIHHFPDGCRLTTDDLQIETGLSRTAVFDAVRRLKEAGLISCHCKRFWIGESATADTGENTKSPPQRTKKSASADSKSASADPHPYNPDRYQIHTDSDTHTRKPKTPNDSNASSVGPDNHKRSTANSNTKRKNDTTSRQHPTSRRRSTSSATIQIPVARRRLIDDLIEWTVAEKIFESKQIGEDKHWEWLCQKYDDNVDALHAVLRAAKDDEYQLTHKEDFRAFSIQSVCYFARFRYNATQVAEQKESYLKELRYYLNADGSLRERSDRAIRELRRRCCGSSFGALKRYDLAGIVPESDLDLLFPEAAK